MTILVRLALLTGLTPLLYIVLVVAYTVFKELGDSPGDAPELLVVMVGLAFLWAVQIVRGLARRSVRGG